MQPERRANDERVSVVANADTRRSGWPRRDCMLAGPVRGDCESEPMLVPEMHPGLVRHIDLRSEIPEALSGIVSAVLFAAGTQVRCVEIDKVVILDPRRQLVAVKMVPDRVRDSPRAEIPIAKAESGSLLQNRRRDGVANEDLLEPLDVCSSHRGTTAVHQPTPPSTSSRIRS